MALIHVPKPSKSAMNPDRKASDLLITQIQHLQHAERRLPLRYRSEIYTHAIRTEGEAAEYIRQVTEAIHKAHADAQAKRAKRTTKAVSKKKANKKKGGSKRKK
jgi:hypothetical protein